MIYVAYSGGKDSTATLILAAQNYGSTNVTALHIDSISNFPGTLNYVEETCKKLKVHLQILKAPDVLDIFASRLHAVTANAPYCRTHMREKPFINFFRDKPGKTLLIGTRKEESKYRSFKKFQKKTWLEYPIADWTTQQVKDFILKNNFKLLPLYRYLDRTGCWACPLANAKQFVFLKYHYPDLFQKLTNWENEHYPLWRSHARNPSKKGEMAYFKISDKVRDWEQLPKYRSFTLPPKKKKKNLSESWCVQELNLEDRSKEVKK